MEEREGGWNIERWGGRRGMSNSGIKRELEQGEEFWNKARDAGTGKERKGLRFNI
jgi:hypothetical protein